jgi:hypothetical protein
MISKEKEIEEEFDKIIFGLEETYKNLVKFKREKNSPIIVEQDGKIVELDPFSVPDSLASENDKDK